MKKLFEKEIEVEGLDVWKTLFRPLYSNKCITNVLSI